MDAFLTHLLKCCVVSLMRLVFRTFLFQFFTLERDIVNLEKNTNEGVFLALTKIGTILK